MLSITGDRLESTIIRNRRVGAISAIEDSRRCKHNTVTACTRIQPTTIGIVARW